MPRDLPGLVSTCLAALVAAELIRIGTQLLLPGPNTAADPIPAPGASLRDRPQIDVAALMAAHLFGASPSAASMDPAAVPVTAANMRLTGTLASPNSRRAGAIVTDDGKSGFYQIGAHVGGAVISRIYADRIILDRGGALELLLMPRHDSPGGSSGPAPARAPGSVETEVAAGPAGDNTGDIAQVMRAGGPVMNEDGRMRGFRIYPGKDRSAFLAAGLHGGDVVVAVNGASVLDQNRNGSQELFRAIGNSARATMTIERNGNTRDVTVDTAQAGTTSVE
jgi:general secretion pathway protein C